MMAPHSSQTLEHTTDARAGRAVEGHRRVYASARRFQLDTEIMELFAHRSVGLEYVMALSTSKRF